MEELEKEKGAEKTLEDTKEENKEGNRKRDLDDKILVQRFKGGDRASFEELVRRYSKYVYTTAFFILRDAQEAEDASQEVFVKTYLSIKDFRGVCSFKTWVRTLTVNTCIDKLRIRSKTSDKKISLDEIDSFDQISIANFNHSPESGFFDRETVKEVLKIIVSLDENYRVPLILRDLQDYSYKEISELTGKPIGTIKTNIHRARKIIKEKLRDSRHKHNRSKE